MGRAVKSWESEIKAKVILASPLSMLPALSRLALYQPTRLKSQLSVHPLPSRVAAGVGGAVTG